MYLGANAVVAAVQQGADVSQVIADCIHRGVILDVHVNERRDERSRQLFTPDHYILETHSFHLILKLLKNRREPKINRERKTSNFRNGEERRNTVQRDSGQQAEQHVAERRGAAVAASVCKAASARVGAYIYLWQFRHNEAELMITKKFPESQSLIGTMH